MGHCNCNIRVPFKLSLSSSSPTRETFYVSQKIATKWKFYFYHQLSHMCGKLSAHALDLILFVCYTNTFMNTDFFSTDVLQWSLSQGDRQTLHYYYEKQYVYTTTFHGRFMVGFKVRVLLLIFVVSGLRGLTQPNNQLSDRRRFLAMAWLGKPLMHLWTTLYLLDIIFWSDWGGGNPVSANHANKPTFVELMEPHIVKCPWDYWADWNLWYYSWIPKTLASM